MMFVVTPDYKYKTTKDIKFENVKVPKNFIFDGVTAPFPASLFLTARDYRKGILASCFHDYMCNNKKNYKRKTATHILLKLWKMNGLASWKSWIIYIFIELYQIFTSDKEWGHAIKER